MPRKQTQLAQEFRQKFQYFGKLNRNEMSKELWNEYYKMRSKRVNESTEHKEALAERKEQRRIKHIETLKQKKETGAYLAAYCKDYTKIENYEKAAADKFNGWVCHHRLETYNSDGERRTVDIVSKELMALDMYYNRPPEELILMKSKDHRQLHNSSPEWRKKQSEAHKGKHWKKKKNKHFS